MAVNLPRFRAVPVGLTCAASVLWLPSSVASLPAREGAPPQVRRPAHVPLLFEPNVGQAAPEVRFLARASSGAVYFTPSEIVWALEPLDRRNASSRISTVVRMRFVGSSARATVTGRRRQRGRVNYLVGNDPAGWRTKLPTYAAVEYADLYRGVDAVYEGADGRLRLTYAIRRGADPGVIRWRYRGVERVSLDQAGSLRLRVRDARRPTGARLLAEKPPTAWQEIGRRRRPVSVRYDIRDDDSVGFSLGRYDPAHALFIDPAVSYSTYLGGTSFEFASSVAVDPAGNAYVTGATTSPDFPTVAAVQPAKAGAADVYVTKLSPSGALLYSTYLGGGTPANAQENPTAIAVGASGNVYVAGITGSTDFPAVNAVRPSPAGAAEGFAFQLNASGSALVYSTYLGGTGTDAATNVAVDSSGNSYVAGYTDSTNFPTANAFQPANAGLFDGFVTKLAAGGSPIVYSTYLGGAFADFAYGIAVDGGGAAHVTGQTPSPNFPTADPFQPLLLGDLDAFVTKFDQSGSALAFSTFLGGLKTDGGFGVALDGSGNVYVTGATDSPNFPTANAYQPANGGVATFDGFVTKLDPTGSILVYSTYLGGSGTDNGRGLAVDASGAAHVTGGTASTNFPTVDPVQGDAAGQDGYAAKLSPTGSALLYSTYLGGSGLDDIDGHSVGLDAAGNAYVVGYTNSTDFPTAGGPQPANAGGYDAFVLKLAGRATAATVAVSGRVVDRRGAGLPGIRVELKGVTARTRRSTKVFATNRDGSFAFSGLEIGGFYRVTPLSPRRAFRPLSRSFSLLHDKRGLTFTADLRHPHRRRG